MPLCYLAPTQLNFASTLKKGFKLDNSLLVNIKIKSATSKQLVKLIKNQGFKIKDYVKKNQGFKIKDSVKKNKDS